RDEVCHRERAARCWSTGAHRFHCSAPESAEMPGRHVQAHPSGFGMLRSRDDLMLWYMETKVKRVRGYEVRVEGGNGPDLTCGILEFHGGALGFVQTMWLLPDKARVLDDAMRVITTSGVANINMHEA